MRKSRAAALTRRTLIAAMPSVLLPLPGLAQSQRPVDWAQPVALNGVPNLHRVTDRLYRSAQPDGEGFRALETLGIRSVISMRQTVEDASLAQDCTLTFHRIPMKSRHVSEDGGAKVVLAMRTLRDSLDQGPTLFHCHHGADRTGLICALYRILEQGWTREDALNELTLGGYGFHPIWANIPRYIETVDLAALSSEIDL